MKRKLLMGLACASVLTTFAATLTVSWDAPLGQATEQYRLYWQGGTNQIDTATAPFMVVPGSTTTATFTKPTGAFKVGVLAVFGGVESELSNQLLIQPVNPPYNLRVGTNPPIVTQFPK